MPPLRSLMLSMSLLFFKLGACSVQIWVHCLGIHIYIYIYHIYIHMCFMSLHHILAHLFLQAPCSVDSWFQSDDKLSRFPCMGGILVTRLPFIVPSFLEDNGPPRTFKSQIPDVPKSRFNMPSSCSETWSG